MLFYGPAVNFHFGISVQIVAGIAVAVEPDITSLDSLGINEFAFICLGVVHIRADTNSHRVIDIIVEYCLDILENLSPHYGIVMDEDQGFGSKHYYRGIWGDAELESAQEHGVNVFSIGYVNFTEIRKNMLAQKIGGSR